MKLLFQFLIMDLAYHKQIKRRYLNVFIEQIQLELEIVLKAAVLVYQSLMQL